MKLTLCEPWLIADLGGPMRVLSFAPHRPGFVTAERILWREVRNSDLTPDLDAEGWLAHQVTALDGPPAVAMMTSRAVARFRQASAGSVSCTATVGLGNAERVGHRRALHDHDLPAYGTINIALRLDAGLTDRAMIEALTIAAEARTAAIIQIGMAISTGTATGTGTDCIALAARPGTADYAGLHTELGEWIGRATHDSVLAAARDWMREQAAQNP
ncbi:adenosylcobinamide amidohydrolase [Paracoccus sp. DMF-8]|uniref:adenosylcobinamide amidohydrolase n=1 Tax=Paracoccus sp. DMF-8 TaxID=3019445 RepID=UPI0023E849C3|nr:adenosylcobinamide amidohydrolase [Paracoccus sp. DMF-8]MDF3606798.1 adenosylcobinamide amidohydrolase [Paracoccus sp. DMF-8]